MIEEFPEKLDDIINFNFNIDFKKLIALLKLLKGFQETISNDLAEVNQKLLRIGDLEKVTEELQIKTKCLENASKEVNETLNNHQSKMMEQDNRIKNINDETFQIKERLGKTEKSIEDHEERIISINNKLEEHLKSSEKIEKSLDTLTVGLGDIKYKTEKNEAELQELTDLFIKEKGETAVNFGDVNKKIEDNYRDIDSRVGEDEKSMSNMITKITENSGKISELYKKIKEVYDQEAENLLKNVTPIVEQKTVQVQGGSAISEETLLEIETMKMGLNTLNETYQRDKEKSERTINDIKKDILILRKTLEMENQGQQNIPIASVPAINTTQTNQQINNLESARSIEEGSDDLSQSMGGGNRRRRRGQNNSGNLNSPLSNMTMESLEGMIRVQCLSIVTESDEIKKIGENVNIIKNNMGNKANRDEIESLQRLFLSKLDKLETKVGNNYSHFENKVKGLKFGASVGDSSGNFDYSAMMQNIENSLVDQIRTISKETVRTECGTFDFTINPSIIELLKKIEKNGTGIKTINKTIEEMNKLLITQEFRDHFGQLEKNIIEHGTEITKLKLDLNELSKSLQMDEESENNDNNNEDGIEKVATENVTLKEKIKIIQLQLQNQKERLEVSEGKIDLMAKQLGNEIKTILRKETEPIINNFKSNLTRFTTQMQDSLNGKVDSFRLINFSNEIKNNIDSKLKSKLERSELDKNTNKINKSISTLESKISRTIVDSIIDLQMDEMPLLTKKGNNCGERCASCNQVLPQSNHLYCSGDLKFNRHKYNIAKTTVNATDRLPEIKEGK